MSEFKVLKDIVLEVPERARDVDLVTFKELMAKIEVYYNATRANTLYLLNRLDSKRDEIRPFIEALREDVDENTMEIEHLHIRANDLEDEIRSLVYVSKINEPPAEPALNQIWFAMDED